MYKKTEPLVFQLSGVGAEEEFSLAGAAGVHLDLRGTFNATVNLQLSFDRVTWFPVAVQNMFSPSTATAGADLTNNGSFITGSIGGFIYAKVVLTTWVSGTVTARVMPLENQIVQHIVSHNRPAVTVAGFSPTIDVVAYSNRFYTEYNAVTTASQVIQGTSRDALVGPDTNCVFGSFTGNVTSSVAGTLRLERSLDGVTWFASSIDVAVAANTPAGITARVLARYNRAVFINGATPAATPILLVSGYTS